MYLYPEALKKYTTFEGRATRKEFWMFVLFYLCITSCLVGLMSVSFILLKNDIIGTILEIILMIFHVVMFYSGLTILVRRLHDTNHSGWWFFITLLPIFGYIILLVLMIQDGQPDQNQYGCNPKKC